MDTNTPGVEELPQRDETSGVTLKGDRVPGTDGWVRGGDRNSPTTRDTKGSVNNISGEEMTSGQDPEAPHIPQRGMAKGNIVELSTKRHTDGAYSARPEYSALVCREYTLLLPEEPAGDPAAAWPQWSVGSPEGTMGIGGIDRRETRTMERNGQCTLLACGQPEDEDEEQGPNSRVKHEKAY